MKIYKKLLKNKICKERGVLLITIKEFKSSIKNIYKSLTVGFNEAGIILDELDYQILEKILQSNN